MTTSMLFVGFLACIELAGRVLIEQMQGISPVLDDETNRKILARHLFVDALSCFILFYLGWNNRAFTLRVLKAFSGDSKALPVASAESRALAYDNKSYFLCIWFLSYQLKNLYDTIMWNDGPEYIFHHVLSLCVCWMALYPGYQLLYAEFYFGISELSTGVLCILANFDDDHGAVGLGDAFPLGKVIIGAVFAVLFTAFRCVVWPIVSYYYTRDALICLKSEQKELKQRSFVIKVFVCCLTGLSALQIIWLGVILYVAYEEFKAIGLL
eukprot:CAMPEP_0178922672 /NCGR_PEP_ID=MMETSP0786-20121207/16290_1 /TAXON_ID=186022 /ORGANISM="Thalassionema frauenfeldii, Strain CCMP 1798" /LENGTH=267 /DNA_ID=CAMNT_0020597075 /DNA_START=186 /DNA_END=989 /DNA_ORIENTATION=+